MEKRSLHDRLVYPSSEDEQNAAADEAWAEIEQLRQLLKLVQSDAGNWLHSGLQERIEAAVGPAGPYRALDDDGAALSASGGT